MNPPVEIGGFISVANNQEQRDLMVQHSDEYVTATKL